LDRAFLFYYHLLMIFSQTDDLPLLQPPLHHSDLAIDTSVVERAACTDSTPQQNQTTIAIYEEA
jgi:hypothetical protein